MEWADVGESDAEEGLRRRNRKDRVRCHVITCPKPTISVQFGGAKMVSDLEALCALCGCEIENPQSRCNEQVV